MAKSFQLKVLLGCILFMGLLVAPMSVCASHIVGGNFKLTYQSGIEYLLELDVFVDCLNGTKSAFVDSPQVGLYSKSGNTKLTSFNVLHMPIKSGNLQIGQTKCADTSNYCLRLEHYETIIRLDPSVYNSENGYYLSWERCCRNDVIVNMENPGSQGVVVYMEIPKASLKNSSPVFKKFPVTLLCVGNYFEFDFEVSDPNGDSLHFSLVEPLAGFTSKTNTNSPQDLGTYPLFNPGPYPVIKWSKGFGIDKILNGKPDLSINPVSGLASAIPTRPGYFVCAVKVEEYRNGKKIGMVIRELQYTVSNCSSNQFPKSSLDEIDGDTIVLFPMEVFSLAFSATDTEGDSVLVEAESDIFDETIVGLPAASFTSQSEIEKGQISINWKPVCAQASDSIIYPIQILFKDNGCPLPKISTAKFWIKLAEPPIQLAPYMCLSDENGKLKIDLEQRADERFFNNVLVEKRINNSNWDSVDVLNQYETSTWFDPISYNSNQTTCFRLIQSAICNEQFDTSYVSCAPDDLNKSPQTLSIQNVTVLNNEAIEIEWKTSHENDFKAYYLIRVSDQSVDTLFQSSNSGENQFHHQGVNADSLVYTYQLAVSNQCGISSQSLLASSVLLFGGTQPYLHNLTWTPFNVWKEGDLQVLAKFDSSDVLDVFPLANTEQTYTHQILQTEPGVWTYQIEYAHPDTSLVAKSNTIKLWQAPVIYIPNAFSPNGDNINESWLTTTDFVKDFHVQVFNRWGQRVFSTSNPKEKWDGSRAPIGVYVYTLSYRSLDGSPAYLQGTVSVMK